MCWLSQFLSMMEYINFITTGGWIREGHSYMGQKNLTIIFYLTLSVALPFAHYKHVDIRVVSPKGWDWLGLVGIGCK